MKSDISIVIGSGADSANALAEKPIATAALLKKLKWFHSSS